MPRARNITVQNHFSKGLVTEATGLTFPENACTDTDNCEFNHFGLASRRLGFDLEPGFVAYSETVTGNVIASYLWSDAGGEGDIAFVVVQVGNNLHYYRVSSTGALSANKHATVTDLTTFVASGATSVNSLECQFANGNGKLFVTNPNLNSFFVSYDSLTNTFTTSVIDIQVRDLEGDTLDTEPVDSRPTTTFAAMNDHHEYNLKNQGWTDANLTAWDTAQTTMPSNSDAQHYFKNSSNNFDFSSGVINNRFVGNSPAPKGHFRYSLYNINRSGNVAGALDEVIAPERVSTCAFFSGRVFYSGLKTASRNSQIFFSQIVERDAQYGQCYQVNDPTSEELFDLLPSDGGIIDILEIGNILKMIPVLNTLVVFATNGVWAITGSQGQGFTANDYSIHKISSVNNLSHTSFVTVEGIPYWWNLEGIYFLKIDPQTNSFRAESVTDEVIRQFFLDIPSRSKTLARGAYDQFTKRIQWIFRSMAPNNFTENYIFDRVLTLDLLATAYFPWSITVTDVKIKSIVNVTGFSGDFELFDVFNGADDVFVGADDVIVTQSTGGAQAITVTDFFVSYDSGGEKITWARNFRESYVDWESRTVTPYESFLVTGYVVRGQAIKKFQQNYVSLYSDVLEADSIFKITSQWDYAELANSGQWSSQQVFAVQNTGRLADIRYRYRPNRIKIRGHGKSCQLRIMNNGNEPFNIIGWSVAETGNQWI